jgi:hypothetical protein
LFGDGQMLDGAGTGRVLAEALLEQSCEAEFTRGFGQLGESYLYKAMQILENACDTSYARPASTPESRSGKASIHPRTNRSHRLASAGHANSGSSRRATSSNRRCR